MQLIDHFAYSNSSRAVDPMYKASFALLVMVLCLVLDRPLVGLLAVAWMWGLATCWARLPALLFGRVLLAEGLFLLLAVTGIALSLGTTPVQGGWNWSCGPLWMGCSALSLETAARLASRALGGAAAMNFLALTTPLVDLIDALRRLRTPALLIDLMTLIYRFIFTLLESLTTMRTAQESRLGYVNFRRGMSSAGILAGQLFVDACHRSRRLQVALESRGFYGDLRVLPSEYRRDRWLPWLGAIAVATLLLARTLG
jgi:cobalt/nickel transport system permease protein